MTTWLRDSYGFSIHGLGRSPFADPELLTSWTPGMFWVASFDRVITIPNLLLIPMDSRTTASQAGDNEYVFYRQGGLSWTVPYLAGVYALAAQVDPSITPEHFWSVALATAASVEIELNGHPASLGPIIQPVGLIEALTPHPPRRVRGRATIAR